MGASWRRRFCSREREREASNDASVLWRKEGFTR